MRYPEPLQELWQPVTASIVPIRVQRSRAVLHCWIWYVRDAAEMDCCCMRVAVLFFLPKGFSAGLSVKRLQIENTRDKITDLIIRLKIWR
jgi:hypothetical protein